MNLRPAFRAFFESSHSSLQYPVALVTRGCVLRAQSSFLRNWVCHSFGPRSLSSLDSSHLAQLSCLCSSAFDPWPRVGRFAVIPALKVTSSFDSTCDPEASPLISSLSGKIPPAAFSGSVMSLSSEPSLLSLSLQNYDSQAQSVSAMANDSKAADEAEKEDVLVQYIVIRKDLVSEQNWPLGSIISQGCHAAVAAIWLSKNDTETALYCRPENLDHMHKVTLEVKGETQLRNLAQKLETAGIAHKLWIEQPENYATCLATKPYYKSQVALHFKKLKLCK